MTEFGATALLRVPIYLENDFDVDDDGIGKFWTMYSWQKKNSHTK